MNHQKEQEIIQFHILIINISDFDIVWQKPYKLSENEPQATWLPLWQILPLPATVASQQDIRGIGKVKQC